MRLTCPSCGAQYEVPEEVIPPHGRDVQCSNCNEMWFQDHPDPEPLEGQARDTISEATRAEDVDPDTPSAKPEASEKTVAEDAPQTDQEHELETDEVATTAPPRRKLDPNVADLLREEAELEARARRSEWSGSVESQPELGLTAAKSNLSHSPSEQPAAVRPTAPHQDSGEAAQQTKKFEDARAHDQTRLPDIEEINSTLRSNEERPPQDPGQTAQAEGEEQRKTRYGFTLTILFTGALVLIYAFAPQIAQSVPQSDPWLSAYVAAVDEGRMWLNGHWQTLREWLDAAAASSGM